MSFSFFLVCNICLYFDLPVHQDGPSDLVQAALLTPAPDIDDDDNYYYDYYDYQHYDCNCDNDGDEGDYDYLHYHHYVCGNYCDDFDYQHYLNYVCIGDGDDYLLRVLLQIFRHQFLSGEGLCRNMFVRHMENAVGEENQMEMAYLGLSYLQFANCNAAAIFGI